MQELCPDPENNPDSGDTHDLESRLGVSDQDRFTNASAAIGCVLLTMKSRQLHVVIHNRMKDPSMGQWSLPCGFMHGQEGFEDAVDRVNKEKIGVSSENLTKYPVGFSSNCKDRRGWILNFAYVVPFPLGGLDVPPTTNTGIVPVNSVEGCDAELGMPEAWGKLAFNHQEVVALSIRLLRERLSLKSSTGLEFLPQQFRMRDLQDVYEAICGKSFNRANFRRLILDTQGIVRPTGIINQTPGVRNAELFERV